MPDKGDYVSFAPNVWVPESRAFWYENWTPHRAQAFRAQPGALDLDLLITPAFAWLYKRTADSVYRDRADAIFAGGVTQAGSEETGSISINNIGAASTTSSGGARNEWRRTRGSACDEAARVGERTA